MAAESDWQIDSAHTSTQFTIRHMMISNVRGDFGKTTGKAEFDGKDPTHAKVDATIDVDSINTREPKRDAHLKGAEFFDIAKYPTMHFVSKKIEKGADGKYKMIGDLTLHGVTKEVVLDLEGPTSIVKDPHGNERVGASATAKINRKDFGVSYNSVLETGGVMVGDDVAINIDVELVKKHAGAPEEKKKLSKSE
jgi:polyisoprenoid-binding protein YceI